MSEQFVKIRQRTGKFNFADPSEESTIIHVEIPKYDFKEKFTFKKNLYPFDEWPWVDALEAIIEHNHPYIRQKHTYSKELESILSEHREEIQKEWEQHRGEEIEREIEQLEDEKRSIQQ